MFFHKVVATFFGTGYSPFAPGTAGALLASIVLVLFNYFNIVLNHQLFFLSIIIISGVLGIYSANKVIPVWGKDPSKVVIDEAVGLWISMLFVPFSYLNLIIAFGLFRLFDIFKPLGIRQLEKLNGGLGVMADDVLAGVYSNIILQFLIYFVL